MPSHFQMSNVKRFICQTSSDSASLSRRLGSFTVSITSLGSLLTVLAAAAAVLPTSLATEPAALTALAGSLEAVLAAAAAVFFTSLTTEPAALLAPLAADPTALPAPSTAFLPVSTTFLAASPTALMGLGILILGNFSPRPATCEMALGPNTSMYRYRLPESRVSSVW